MKTARDAILGALTATRPVFPPLLPSQSRVLAQPSMPADADAILRARLEAAGGRLQIVSRRDWVARVDWPIELAPSRAARFHSARSELASHGAGPADLDTSDFEQLDLCVLRGEFAVVESGAVWHVPRTPHERRAALLAEHLVVVIEGDALVATLHQAYERIDLAALSFGWFLCGPSKTSDIEQALVLGAHGPRSMSLVWLRDEPAEGASEPA